MAKMQQILTILMLLVLLGSFLLLAGLVYFSEGLIRSRPESINRDSAAQRHAMRPNQSGHGAMGAYLLFVMVAFVIIYLFYAVIHPERF